MPSLFPAMGVVNLLPCPKNNEVRDRNFPFAEISLFSSKLYFIDVIQIKATHSLL